MAFEFQQQIQPCRQNWQAWSDYQFYDTQLPYPGRKPTHSITRSTFNLAATSRQIQSEIGDRFYEKNTFDFNHNMKDLVPFIECLEARGKVQSLQRIVFSFPTADPRVSYERHRNWTSKQVTQVYLEQLLRDATGSVGRFEIP